MSFNEINSRAGFSDEGFYDQPGLVDPIQPSYTLVQVRSIIFSVFAPIPISSPLVPSEDVAIMMDQEDTSTQTTPSSFHPDNGAPTSLPIARLLNRLAPRFPPRNVHRLGSLQVKIDPGAISTRQLAIH